MNQNSGENKHLPHILQVENLHAHYGRVCALKGISFQTSCGRAIALIGGNGAGKTTLMKAIVGLIPSSTGHVYWRGGALTRYTHEIAYLPQRSDHDENFPITVRGLVEMGRYPLLGLLRRFGADDRKAVNEALDIMQITDLAHRQVGALSGGQRQRALIARALAQQAHVLLLDEPFAGLDPPAAETLSHLMRSLVRGDRLVMASHHDLSNVSEIFDEVLLLNKKIITFGTPDQSLTVENLREAMGS